MKMESVSLEHSRKLRRRGALILAVFAVLWAAVAASGLAPVQGWVVRIAAVLVAASVVVLALRGPRSNRPERQRQQPEGWHRQVGLVNGAQFVAIGLVVAGCVATDVPQLVPPVVCLIVGVHFFPLARLFDQPQYTWTAAGMCVAASTGLAMLGLGTSLEASRLAVGSIAAFTLWATAAQLATRG